MPRYAIDGPHGGRWAPEGPEDGWVAPSADLIGAVRLGRGASVWFGAVIRADNTPIVLGARSNVQEGAVLHSDLGAPLVGGADCTVGHRAILHGCTVGDRVLVGMGATVLNRARIGDDCLVGAGALVTEGRSFPPGQLIVGAPARAVRALTAEEVAGLRASADGYARRARQYAAGLERLPG